MTVEETPQTLVTPPTETTASTPGAVTRKTTDGQLVVALAIVIAMGLLGLALVGAGVFAFVWSAKNGKDGTAALATVIGGVSTILGAMATALNAPNGITAALVQNKGTAQ